MATLSTRLRRDERGQAVVELALTLPLLLLMVMGMFDFGVMFQRYEIVTNAAREGARVGVLTGAGYSTARRRAARAAVPHRRWPERPRPRAVAER